ncbi:MAG: MoxR family ATPase [Verrucomicrobiales bacterium]
MGYPERGDEVALAQRLGTSEAPEAVLARGAIQPVLAAADLPALRRALAGVLIKDELLAYIVDLVRKTRESDSILVGAGPRATQAIVLASRALAAIQGRDFVTPDDVREIARPALGHRLVLRPEYEIEGMTVEEAIGKVLEAVPVPR